MRKLSIFITIAVVAAVLWASYPFIESTQLPFPEDVVAMVMINGRWVGSSVFIAPGKAITAAHVIVLPLGEFRRRRLPFQWDVQMDPAPKKPQVKIEVIYKKKTYVVAKYHLAPEKRDVALLEVKDVPNHRCVPLSLVRRPNYQEQLFYVGALEEQPILVRTWVMSPAFLLPWAPQEFEEVPQEMILHQFRAGPGSSGSLVMTEEGKGIAVIVGGTEHVGIAAPLYIEPVKSWLEGLLWGS